MNSPVTRTNTLLQSKALQKYCFGHTGNAYYGLLPNQAECYTPRSAHGSHPDLTYDAHGRHILTSNKNSCITKKPKHGGNTSSSTLDSSMTFLVSGRLPTPPFPLQLMNTPKTVGLYYIHLQSSTIPLPFSFQILFMNTFALFPNGNIIYLQTYNSTK
jgi:hypothetical protein